MSYKTYEVRVHDDKTIEWLFNGKLHREDGPAVICSSGYKAYYLNGNLHREAGPAVIGVNGTQLYYLNGKYHREDGPAIIDSSGDQYYYLDNKNYSKKEYDAEIKRRKKEKEKKEIVELTVADVEKLVGKKVKIIKT